MAGYQARTKMKGDPDFADWADLSRMSSAMEDVMNTMRNGSVTANVLITNERGDQIEFRHAPKEG